jgi:hypothetical protein
MVSVVKDYLTTEFLKKIKTLLLFKIFFIFAQTLQEQNSILS